MFLLHVTHPSGAVQSVRCASAFLRALWIISLTETPVTMRCEEVVSA